MTLYELAQLIPKNIPLNEEVMPPYSTIGYAVPDLWVRFNISSVYTVGIEQFKDGYNAPLEHSNDGGVELIFLRNSAFRYSGLPHA